MALILLYLLLISCSFAVTLQSDFINCTQDSNSKYPLYFLGFFPCLSNDHDEYCDRLTLTAVQLAIETINQDTNLLKCFTIELIPVHLSDPEQNPTQIFELLYHKHNDLPIHGVIGPFHADIAVIFSYVFGLYLPAIQISYSVTDPVLEDRREFPHFYSTVPSDVFFGRVINRLLDRFGWQKLAMLSTNDRHHVLASQKLTVQLRANGKQVNFLGSFFDSAMEILNTAESNNIRILVAVIMSQSARSLLCQAYRIGLTSADHVWILPGIYDPQWWYLDEEYLNSTQYNCTNEQMMDAINTTLFVDSLPVYTEASIEEADKVLSKIFNVTSIFEGDSFALSDTDFHRLLHSKVLNAYDATTALALTWNMTLTNLTITTTGDHNDLNILLNQSWKITTDSKRKLVNSLQYHLKNILSPYSGLASRYDFGMNRSDFGASLITQFIDNGECILGWYETFNHSSQLQPNTVCQWNKCCNATWKGGYRPLDGYCPEGSCTCRILESSTKAYMIFLVIILVFGIVVSIALQAVNYCWRENKFFRSSSPVINAIITFGCTLEYITGIFFLANYYIGIEDSVRLTPICNFGICFFWLSLIVINSSIFMKNWRIFRIFYNPSHKERGNLSNRNLVIGVVIMFLPVIVVLICLVTFQRFSPYPVLFEQQCPNITSALVTYRIEDHCIEQISFDWDGIIASYIFLIFIGIFILGCYNCRISSHYKKEGELAILTAVMSLILFVFYYLVGLAFSSFMTSSSMIKNHMPAVVSCIWLYSSFILGVLYVSKAIAIMREKEFRPRVRTRGRSTVRRKFVELNDQLFNLRYRLKKINESIENSTSVERKYSVESNATMITLDQ